MISRKHGCWADMTYPSSKSTMAEMNTSLIFGCVSGSLVGLGSSTHIEDSIDPAKGRLKGRCRKEIRAAVPTTVSWLPRGR